jgi:colicin import membrane protein
MHAADDRLAFTPPPEPALVRAFALAVVAHLLLAVALTQGLKWQREVQTNAVEAELWSAVPQQAAPPEPVAPPPPPPPPPQQTVPRVQPQPEPPVQRQPDIALEREKQKRELQQRREAELEREREREQQRRKLLEAQKKREDEVARRKQEQQKLVAEAKRKDEDKKRRQQEQEAREARDAQRVAKQREENMRRIQGMAGGTGAPSSAGTAARSSGPSAGWGGRVQARVRPNIVFTDDISGNPNAEVEVRLAPDGTIIGKRLVRSSGVKAWDEAVLRALDKTEVLPRDVDGTVPSPVTISFRPKG